MKFVCLSDIHLSSDNPEARLDNLVDTQMKKFEFVLKFAKDHDADILQAGDVFHRPRSWMLLPMVIDLLKKYKVRFFCVRGQHDDYMYSDETKDRTNLGILSKIGLVTPLGKEPIKISDDVCIYGANFGDNLPVAKKGSYNIGVIHTSISDEALWPGHNFTPASKFLKSNNSYDFILVGDIHRFFKVNAFDGRILINAGPMLRRESTQYNFTHDPSLYLLDTKKHEIERVMIPHDPADKILSRDHIERQQETEGMLDEFINSIKSGVDTNTCVSFIENLLIFSKENNVEPNVMQVLANFMERTRRNTL